MDFHSIIPHEFELPRPIFIVPATTKKTIENSITTTTLSQETTQKTVTRKLSSETQRIEKLPVYNNQSDLSTPAVTLFQPTNVGDIVTNYKNASMSNTAFSNIRLTRICGQPGFCTSEIYANCPNITVSECQECNNGLGAVFIFFIICLGIAILLGNLLIILVGYRKHKENKKDKMDVCKMSLALADMVAGKLFL